MEIQQLAGGILLSTITGYIPIYVGQRTEIA